MKRSGSADLPLHYGTVPPWLAERMARLGLAITESIINQYGKSEMIRRLSDPFWFQSLGAVMGMDWHSSGITTSVMGALKKTINPISRQLGIYICGGRGKQSRQTPEELMRVGYQTGLDGNYFGRCSRLSAKVDNTAIQDGYQLYLHSFVLSDEGQWTVIQQGMNNSNGMARRYHWHSSDLKSFTEEPHTAVCGKNSGTILNLTDKAALPSKNGIMQLASEHPEKILKEVRLMLPRHHEIRASDVDIKRLGSMLWVAHEQQPAGFEDLLLMEGLGPRTLQSLALVSEVIHGTPSRFADPARFSFAHGGKDGHPFPVPLNVYDETINTLKTAVAKAKLGDSDKRDAIKKLHELSQKAEENFIPNSKLEDYMEIERNNSWKYGGKTVWDDAKKPRNPASKGNGQLTLF